MNEINTLFTILSFVKPEVLDHKKIIDFLKYNKDLSPYLLDIFYGKGMINLEEYKEILKTLES